MTMQATGSPGFAVNESTAKSGLKPGTGNIMTSQRLLAVPPDYSDTDNSNHCAIHPRCSAEQINSGSDPGNTRQLTIEPSNSVVKLRHYLRESSTLAVKHGQSMSPIGDT